MSHTPTQTYNAGPYTYMVNEPSEYEQKFEGWMPYDYSMHYAGEDGQPSGTHVRTIWCKSRAAALECVNYWNSIPGPYNGTTRFKYWL